MAQEPSCFRRIISGPQIVAPITIQLLPGVSEGIRCATGATRYVVAPGVLEVGVGDAALGIGQLPY